MSEVKLNEAQRAVAKAAVTKALEDGPWPLTYVRLTGIAAKSLEAQWPELSVWRTDADRMADQVLQKLRKSGAVVQVGRGQWWKAVAARSGPAGYEGEAGVNK